MASNKNYKFIYSCVSFLIPLIVYIITLAPSVSWVDSDELAAVSSLLGVAHPTGYPLFTIIGKIFTMLPFGEEVYMLNIMSAVISSFAVMIFFYMMYFLFSEFRLSKNDRTLAENISSHIILNISLAASLILAFSLTFWDNANVIEVYSLHVFFIILLLYLFLKTVNYCNDKKNFLNQNNRYFLLFLFTLGLSFSNHLSTLFLFPAMIYLFLKVYSFNNISIGKCAVLFIIFLSGMTLYIYLYVRADNNLISWGQTNTLHNFYDHITGRQYETRMFTSFADFKDQLAKYISYFFIEFSYINLLFIVPGCAGLYNRNRQLFYFTLILFITCILMASAYTIFDIYSYYLVCTVTAAVWTGMGIFFIFNRFKINNFYISFAAVLLFLIPVSINFGIADKSNDTIVKDYDFNLFKSAPENSIIISNYTPTFYFQLVKKIRPDIIFINRDYLYNKWYVNSLINTYPDIYKNCKNEFDIFSEELSKLTDNKSKYLAPVTEADNQAITRYQNSLKNLLNKIIETNIKYRNVFSTLEIDEVNDEKFASEYKKIPQGVLLKLRKENDPDDFTNIELKYSSTQDVSKYSNEYFKDYIMTTYYKANLNQAKYLIDKKDFISADASLKKALDLKPVSQELKLLQQKLNQLKLNN